MGDSGTLWHSRAFVSLVCVLALAFGGCGRQEGVYDQSSPDDVLKSAMAMVKNGETGRLASLVYAESPEMRTTLRRLGTLLQNMQELSIASKEKFPEEFAAMRAEAEAAAAAGKPTTLLSMALSQTRAGGGNRRRGAQGGGGPDPDAARELVNQLFADPYSWLEQNSARLTTIQPTDDAAYVLLDGQPAIPIIGLAMRKEGEKWYVSLPSNVPPVSSVWPKSKAQWSILASMIKILDNAVKEMTGEVRSGAVTSLKSLGDKASDKLLFPAGIAFVAYGKELDVRSRVDRRLAQFSRRQSDWVKQRRDDSGGQQGVAESLVSAISSLAPAEVEQSVRARKALTFEGMSHAQFEQTVSQWLALAGLNVDFSGDLASPSVDEIVKAWQGVKKKN